MVVSLWSGPRNLSTALMYFFAHRGDFKVLDEPFFGAFLQRFNVWRPSRELALAQMEKDPDKVMRQILDAGNHQNLFLKNMANHLPLIEASLEASKALNWKHIFLYRDPAAVIQSYKKQMQNISLFDLAYKEQVEWLQKLQKNKIDFYLLDSAKIQEKPSQELAALCQFLNIPFSTEMLNWPAGPIAEDGVWAKFWYHRVHQSTGIEAKQANEQLSTEIKKEPLYLECLPYYQELQKAHYEQIQYARSAQ